MSIKIEALGHTYMPGGPFERSALSDINLNIKGGTFLGLIGHTGSGKSTLVQHLNGLLKPTGGRIFINDEDITQKGTDLKKLRQRVGLVFQYPEHQLFEETVYLDIAYGPKNMGLTEQEIKERVEWAINIVELPDKLLKKSPFELSGGQKRRAAIAGVLAMKPKILILDEPTAGLDPHGRDEILNNIALLHKQQSITVILVSHSMEDIARIAEEVVVMHKGTIAMHGSVAEVFKRGRELVEMGLNVPQVTSLIMKLRDMGYALPDDIFTVKRAKEELLKLVKGATS